MHFQRKLLGLTISVVMIFALSLSLGCSSSTASSTSKLSGSFDSSCLVSPSCGGAVWANSDGSKTYSSNDVFTYDVAIDYKIDKSKLSSIKDSICYYVFDYVDKDGNDLFVSTGSIQKSTNSKHRVYDTKLLDYINSSGNQPKSVNIYLTRVVISFTDGTTESWGFDDGTCGLSGSNFSKDSLSTVKDKALSVGTKSVNSHK